MAALPIIPDGDPLEQGAAGLFPRSEGTTVDQLPFQGSDKALHRRVVVAVALAAHAVDRFGFREELLIVTARLRAAPITVADQPLSGLPQLKGAPQGIPDERSV